MNIYIYNIINSHGIDVSKFIMCYLLLASHEGRIPSPSPGAKSGSHSHLLQAQWRWQYLGGTMNQYGDRLNDPYWCVLRREFSVMIHFITRNFIIPATPIPIHSLLSTSKDINRPKWFMLINKLITILISRY